MINPETLLVKNIEIIDNSKLSMITPETGQHAAFVGQNGSGKSFIAKKLLSKLKGDILIIDPKREIGANGATYFSTPSALLKNWGGLMIFTPSLEYDNREGYNDVFKIVYFKKNCIVFIDELYAVVDGADPHPDYLKALYTRGRSMGISVWGCTQRPSRLPLYTLTEARRHYTFRLTLPDDRKRMSGMIGMNLPVLTDHNFVYFDERLMEPKTLRYEG